MTYTNAAGVDDVTKYKPLNESRILFPVWAKAHQGSPGKQIA
jgi:hypothetical protein